LPGIAGFLLSIGMAVDANIIIFERLKEELREGKNFKLAIEVSFKRAFAAILDSNVTTLIAAITLFWLGTGTIKGFAITLSVGIIASMFTSIYVTHMFMDSLNDSGVIKTTKTPLLKG
ncbi:MAG: MMPL family transporter, partial [bacterium]